MLACHDLRDHPAHRSADDIRLRNGQRIKQPDRVLSHVMEGIGYVWSLPGHERCRQRTEVRRSPLAEMRRAPDVTVVETDHAIPACHQFLAELTRPPDHPSP